ncbi:AhpC/TSA family protein [Armatimonas sp.]|uniref:AhpC/TSA family protein n=1 Tax=Armatimonas sp. TaxID=1872638 RepID=UPI003753E162
MRDHEQELQARGIEVVLISFAPPELARHWLEATQFPFPLFLDPERRAYVAFGLGSSVLAAWHPKMFLYYFRLLAKGRKLMPVKGDPYQLGGDFLLDVQGSVRLAYPSSDPADRTPLSQILAAVS